MGTRWRRVDDDATERHWSRAPRADRRQAVATLTTMMLDEESASSQFARRWVWARPFLVISVICVTAGGFVAAVTRPTGFDLGPWVAAYLVLVGGVAQGALGVGQAWLRRSAPSLRLVMAEAVTWGLGVAGTLIGQLAQAPLVTTAGGVATAVALVMFLRSVSGSAGAPRWLSLAYRGCIAIVLVSTPIGLVLAWTGRH